MKKILILQILLLYTFIASAQLDNAYFNKLKSEKVISNDSLEWIQFGPGMSGYCEFFWPHPTDANTMFMAPDMFNAYGSFDGGTSWKSIKDYDGLGFDMGRTYDIEFSIQNPNFGLATDELGGIFKTNDKGRSWNKTGFNLGGAHNEIAVDPNDDNIWFIGAGTFWDVKRFHRTASDNTGGGFRNAAVLGHIYKSIDKGVTWKKISNGLPNKLAVAKIIVDPRDSKKVIMAANTGLYLSSDGGNSWTLSQNNGLPNSLPRDLTSYYDKATNQLTLFLVDQTSFHKSGNSYTSKGGVYKSTDGGKNWQSITGDLGLDLTKINSSSAKWYYQRSVAKWLGVNSGQIGNEMPTNILQNYNRIVVNPKNPDEIYISHNIKHDFSFGPGDVWKTDNGGKNWYICARSGKYWDSNKDQSYWNSRAVNVSGKNTTYAHLQHEMDIREEIWGCRFLSINPNGEVFISLDQQVLRTQDGGKSWKQIDDDETNPGSKDWINRGNSNLPGRYIYLETGVKDRKFFLSGEHGLWKSAPLGSFAGTDKVAATQIEGQVNSGGAHSTATLAVHPDNPDIIYTLQFRQNHRNYFRSSTDGGKTWKNIGKPFNHPETNQSSEHIYSSSLMVDPQSPNTIYFTAMKFSPSEINEGGDHGFDDFGVYKSTDGGKNWTIKNSGIPANVSIRRLEMHPAKSNVLFAASNLYQGIEGGLYKSTNKAESWSKVTTIPAAIKSVNNVYIDKTTHDIYISCGMSWGQDNEGGVWKSSDDGATWKKIFDLNYVWQTETSPLNPDIIIVSVPRSQKHNNPGAYISRDGGKTWVKVNRNHAHPHAITDLKPDNQDENVFWSAGWGSGWYKGTFQSPANTEETISIKDLPSKLEQSQSISVQVPYSVNAVRDLVVVMNSPTGQWLGNGKQKVQPGSGIAVVELNLAELPEIGENYTITVNMRPDGGSNTQNLKQVSEQIDIIAPLPDADFIEFIGLPSEIVRSNSFEVTVYYEATAQRDISVVFTTPGGQYITNTKQTVEAGNGQITLTINPSQSPEPGEGYGIDATIRTVGGSYADNTYNKKELIDIVVITSLVDNHTSADGMIYPNPSTGKVFLPESSEKWTVYSITGEKILETSEKELEMSGYPKGLYLFRSGAKVQKIHLR